jgi:3D (Asp-Asp-Asp) domain-containing protein/urease gamma subunit
MRNADAMARDWGHAIVVDPRELDHLRVQYAKVLATRNRLRGALPFLVVAVVAAATLASWETARAGRLREELRAARRHVARSSSALTTLARSHENILAATQAAPSVGTKSWGKRFTVTMYLPRSEKYGDTNDGITATNVKADPEARLVAVDPKLIPYGSWLWIEGLGWFRAEDCGSAIKGFRLDVLVATEAEAMRFGKQDRFVIVVPPTNA